MKVTTDTCLFGAWCAEMICKRSEEQNHVPANLLDIGTGTALLPLMIRQKNKLLIDAVEIDKDAAEQAAENIRNLPWSKDIRIINDDIRSWSSAVHYDYIVSNPPFYENELKSDHPQKNIAHHSHQLRLAELLSSIKKRLKPGGIFFLLLPYKRKKEIEDLLLKECFFAGHTIIVSQSLKHSPFRLMIMGSDREFETAIVSELSIWNEVQEYTPEFRQLLQPYYLYL